MSSVGTWSVLRTNGVGELLSHLCGVIVAIVVVIVVVSTHASDSPRPSDPCSLSLTVAVFSSEGEVAARPLTEGLLLDPAQREEGRLLARDWEVFS